MCASQLGLGVVKAERERRAHERATKGAVAVLVRYLRRHVSRVKWRAAERRRFDEAMGPSSPVTFPSRNSVGEWLGDAAAFAAWYEPRVDGPRLVLLAKAMLQPVPGAAVLGETMDLINPGGRVTQRAMRRLLMLAVRRLAATDEDAAVLLRLLVLTLTSQERRAALLFDDPEAVPLLCCAIQRGVSATTASGSKGSTASAKVHVSALASLVAQGAAKEAVVTNLLAVPLLMTRLTDDVASKIVLPKAIEAVKQLASDPQLVRIVASARPGNGTLFLVGNLVDLFALCISSNKANDERDVFVAAVTALLWQCRSYVARQAHGTQNVTHHPLFDWYSGPSDPNDSRVLPSVAKQIAQLWSAAILRRLFASTETTTALQSIALMQSARLILCIQETLPATKKEILSAIAYLPGLLPPLWRDIVQFGPTGQFAVFLNAAEKPFAEPLMPLLQLFCLGAAQLFEVLDLQEMYEQQEPFRLDELAVMAKYLQQFMFKCLVANASVSAIGEVDKTLWSGLLNPMRAILGILHERDEARSFCPQNTWPIAAASTSGFKGALVKGTEPGPMLVLRVQPTAIPFATRLQLLQKTFEDKRQADFVAAGGERPRGTILKLHRLTILDDALKTFSRLTREQLQGVVRIQFVNQQGLNEAGIDQMGLLKEFLEESCKQLLHPSHGMFAVTHDQQLYPAPFRDDGRGADVLPLFDLLGRLLGKAVREGIVLDTPLSPVFLAKLHRAHSPLSDLPQLDDNLYKNLMFVKRYDGNVEDLALTFSIDEEIVKSDGSKSIVSRDLRPGGSAFAVTSDNKIAYVHVRADYRLNRQVALQTKAFVNGFSLALEDQWLRCFTPAELRRLVSGDDADLDMEDLKRHAQYAGGYHGSHKVVQWLWQTVKEMAPEDQKLFLRYVTSCSKPPLSGFKSLNPAFTVRSVDSDPATSAASSAGIGPPTVVGTLSAFFGIGASSAANDTDRLPSASTCFNLLKLPVYKSKKHLKERLLYAIRSNAGFELS